VLRIDFHVVKALHGWCVQNARGGSIPKATKVEDAIFAATAHAQSYVDRGWIARATIHRPGKGPETVAMTPKG
jgi:hypothetical protein